MVKEEEKEIKLAIGNAPAVVPMCLPLSLLAINVEHRSLEESMVVNTRRSIGDCKKLVRAHVPAVVRSLRAQYS